MSNLKSALLKEAEALGLYVYPKSPDEAEGAVAAIVKDGGEKRLAVSGAKAGGSCPASASTSAI